MTKRKKKHAPAPFAPDITQAPVIEVSEADLPPDVLAPSGGEVEVSEADLPPEVLQGATEAPAPSPAPPAPRRQPVGMLESGLRGVGNGLTLGWGDELAAASQPLLEAAFGEVPRRHGVDPQEAALAQLRQDTDEAQLDHPVAFGVGNAAGSAATQALLSRVGLGRVGAAVGGGLPGAMAENALVGGIQGAGDSPDDRVTGAVAGGELGAFVPPALHGVARMAAPALRRAGQALGDYAARQALPGAGMGAGPIAKILKREGGTEQFGRDIQASGIRSGTVLPPSFRQQFDQAEQVAIRAGDEMRSVAETVTQPADVPLDDVRALLGWARSNVGKGDTAYDAAVASLEESLRRATTGSPGYRVLTPTGSFISSGGERAEMAQVPFQALWKLRQVPGRVAGSANDQQGARAARKLYGRLSEAMTNAIDDPEQLARWQQASRNYEVATQVREASGSGVARLDASSPIGLPQAVAMASGNPTAVAGGVLSNMMRGRGSSSLSSTARLSSGLATGAANVAESAAQNPTASRAIAQSSSLGDAARQWAASQTGRGGQDTESATRIVDIARIAPQRLGIYAEPLQRAAATGGDEAVRATHFKLYQANPGYRLLIRSLNGEED